MSSESDESLDSHYRLKVRDQDGASVGDSFG